MDNPEALPRENDGARNVGDISLNDIRDAFTCVLGLELTHKIVFIGVCACLLTCLTLQTGIQYTSATDVFVYCAVYSAWVTLCLPWLVQNMDGKIIKLVLGVFFRLFGADLGVLAWKIVRGHSYVFHRGLRMRPLFESSMSWLSDAGYNLRYGVVVAAVVASLVSFLISIYRKFFQANTRVASKYISTDLEYEESLTSKAESSPTLTLGKGMGRSGDGVYQDPTAPRNPLLRGNASTMPKRGTVRETDSQNVQCVMPPAQQVAYEKGIMRYNGEDRMNLNFMDTVNVGVDRSGRKVGDPAYAPGNSGMPLRLEGASRDWRVNPAAFSSIHGAPEPEDRLPDRLGFLQPEAVFDPRHDQMLNGELSLHKRLNGAHPSDFNSVECNNKDFDLNSAENTLCVRRSQHGIGRAVQNEGSQAVREYYRDVGTTKDQGGGAIHQPHHLHHCGGSSMAATKGVTPMIEHYWGGPAGLEKPMTIYGGDTCGDGRVGKDVGRREYQRPPQNLQGVRRALYNIQETLIDE